MVTSVGMLAAEKFIFGLQEINKTVYSCSLDDFAERGKDGNWAVVLGIIFRTFAVAKMTVRDEQA